MKANKKKKPDIIFRNGKPRSVILDIDEYQEMLGRLESIEDFKILEEMKEKPFEPLDDFLNDKSLMESKKEDHGEIENFFTEQERKALEPLIKEVQEFSKRKVKAEAQESLKKLFNGIFESEENPADNHDQFLYGAPKRK